MSDVTELLRDLVRIPSESGQEEGIVRFLERTLADRGWAPKRFGRNVYALLGRGGPLLLLNSHTDTVPVGEGWSVPSHDAVVRDGRVYGRGANDAKGCVAAMIAGAARAYASTSPPGRTCLAFTCEEETSGAGLEVLLPELPRPDAAVIGEPTNLQPAVAQKGLLLLEITARGRSAHAAWGGGENAVEKAAWDVLALAGLRFEREHPVLGLPSLAVTQIAGGARHNVIPDLCRILVDVRTTPSYTPEELAELVRGTVGGEVLVRSSRLGAVDTDPGHPIVRAAMRAGRDARPFGSPTLSDWVFLRGVPAVKAGPGDSRRSHTPDEYVSAVELEDGAAFYERLIRGYFQETT